MIQQNKISLISNNTFVVGGRRIPESVIEKDYCISWFLFGLAQSSIKSKLIFKGGTALRRCYFKNYRFSEDLDFTLIADISLEEILVEFKKIFNWIHLESGIIFALAKRELSSENTYTFYISYLGPLPGKEKEVKVDITFREILITPIEERSIIKTYKGYDDFTFILHEVEEKMKFKGITFKGVQDAFLKKEMKLKKLWNIRLSQQMTSLPEYDKVFRVVKRIFRQVELLTNNDI